MHRLRLLASQVAEGGVVAATVRAAEPDEQRLAAARELGEKYAKVSIGTADVKPRPSECFHAPDLSMPGCLLCRAELEFFRTNGFLVKKGLLSKERVAALMDLIWEEIHQIPPGRVRREDPSTWIDPQWSASKTPTEGLYQGRAPVFRMTGRSPLKLHAFGATEPVVDLLPNDPKVQQIAKRILSPELKPVRNCRGVYANFPTSAGTLALGPHTDRSAQQLNVCAYLDEVPERGGGFTLFPRSHAILYHAHDMESNFSPKGGGAAGSTVLAGAMSRCLETITPLEICGGPGDVIFWHGRTLHSVGIHTGKGIRFAVFGDFQVMPKEGWDGLFSAEEEKLAGQYEWFKDTQLLRQDRAPETGDMFQHWAMSSDEKEE